MKKALAQFVSNKADRTRPIIKIRKWRPDCRFYSTGPIRRIPFFIQTKSISRPSKGLGAALHNGTKWLLDLSFIRSCRSCKHNHGYNTACIRLYNKLHTGVRINQNMPKPRTLSLSCSVCLPPSYPSPSPLIVIGEFIYPLPLGWGRRLLLLAWKLRWQSIIRSYGGAHTIRPASI